MTGNSISITSEKITWEDIIQESKKLGIKKSQFVTMCIELYFDNKKKISIGKKIIVIIYLLIFLLQILTLILVWRVAIG